MVVVWVLVGVVVIAVELRHLALYALFAAFGGAVVSGIWPDAVLGQVAVVLVVAVVGVVGIRPILRRRRWRPTIAHVARGGHGGIVGAEVFALDEVGDEAHPGHVRLVGERWLARSADRSPITAVGGGHRRRRHHRDGQGRVRAGPTGGFLAPTT